MPAPPAARRRPTLTASVVATALAGGVLVAVPPESVAAPPRSYGPKGVDTSLHNHAGTGRPIDWRRVAADNSFAFLKATQGTGYLDPWFVRDFKAASETSLLRAPYHFFDPRSTTDGAAQADTFIRTARAAGYTGTGPGELPPVLDVESVRANGKDVCPPALRADQLGIFLMRVTSAFDRTPIVYTRASFVSQCMNGNGEVFRGYPLWLARYGSGSGEPQQVPGTGARPWTFWQYTESETVAGIPGKDGGNDGPADRNVYQGSPAQLRAMANMGGDPFPLPGIPWPALASAVAPATQASSSPKHRRTAADRRTARPAAGRRGLGGGRHRSRPGQPLALDKFIREIR